MDCDRKAEYGWRHDALWWLANVVARIGFAFGHLADWMRDGPLAARRNRP